MNKNIAIVIVAVVILAGGYLLLSGGNKASQSPGSQTQLTVPAPGGFAVSEKEAAVTDVTVRVKNHRLDIIEVIIPAGGTVTWINEDDLTGFSYNSHSPTSGAVDPTGTQGEKGVVSGSGSGVGDGVFALALGTNKSLSYTFSEPGTYTYYIAEHPLLSGEGKIVVEAVRDDTEVRSEVRTIQMTARQWEFVPSTVTLALGEQVQLVITNEDVAHGIAIPALGVSELLKPGTTQTVEFTATERGIFSFFCNVSCGLGHGDMKGELIVE